MAKLTEQQAQLFRDKNFGVLGIARDSAPPHLTPIWVDWDGESVVMNTSRGRVKERLLSKDAQASVSVFDVSNPYRYVTVTGRVELVDEGAEEHIDKLAQKYIGEERYPWRAPGERRVLVKLHPEHVAAYNVE